ncbi:MAG: efflux RND transporter periplasmic adaptor subunit [Anaerolineae bacterium]|nr:efflux RND transporter periplasmic adaptor subunit [Anaerolineae bacterium]MDW8101936.1 efflux RND transporter periplasmic adaptor subunit [Anaerolineae bacterium]
MGRALKSWLLILAALTFTAACAQFPKARGDLLEASGTIEATEISVASEIGGKVVEVAVEEGDEIRKGNLLIRLDDSEARQKVAEAEAVLKEARAHLEKVQRGATTEELDLAEAALQQAIARRDAARRAWEDASAALKSLQELEVEIEKTKAELITAEGEIRKAEVQLRMAQIMRDRYQGDGSAQGKVLYTSYSYQVEAAKAALEAAKAKKLAVEIELKDLEDKKSNPYPYLLKALQAEGEYRQAEAHLLSAQAELEKARAGARPEEIELAHAAVKQAEAALEIARYFLTKHTIHAPASGFVSECAVKPGENLLPGKPFITIASLDEVELTLYIPLAKLGLMQLGQEVEVRVDSFPGEVFKGQIVYISPEAEFTPRSVQTKEERITQVFRVQVKLPNPDHKLKPGMYAEAIIRR